MWVRKSPVEIQQEKAGLLGPVLRAMGTGVFFALGLAFGPRWDPGPPMQRIPFEDWPIDVPALALLFALVSLPFWVYLRRSSFSESNDRHCLCELCFTPQRGNPSKRCACDGSLEAMWKWKWIDDTLDHPVAGTDHMCE
jgi:hypothetical protein